MRPRRIVGLSGNITRPSRTRGLVARVLAAAEAAGLGAVEAYDLVDAGPALGAATSRAGAPPDLDRIWSAIETCDALVVGSPVFKASYGGLFKHFFDLIDKDALRGRPAVLCATGRLPEYGVMIEGRLLPLFRFFGAAVAEPTVYASDDDFSGPDLRSERVEAAVEAAVAALDLTMRGSRGPRATAGHGAGADEARAAGLPAGCLVPQDSGR